MLILGIDDSGRGPIIGPMIMSGCLIDEIIEQEFRKKGVKDSKKLTDDRREILAEVVKAKAIAYEILVIHPREIDSSINSGTNLNTIEALKAGEIINVIAAKTQGIDKIKVVVDCPSPNIEKWKKTLITYVKNPEKFDFVVEHKADVNHIACSAASIIGKSEREKQVRDLKQKLGLDFGSGYPSDPVTCKFLTDYSKKHRKDGIFRETWQTWKNNCKIKEQKKLEF